MSASRISQVVERLRTAALLQDLDHLSDGQLLGRFLDQHDQAACAALVRRHGQMVWGVCRRLLDHHDAEDAFQATFLVLVRRAGSVRPREMVANWLHGVAHQTALKARARSATRRAREKQVMDMPQPETADAEIWSDVQPLLDQELGRLPAKYRAIIILCDLEGKPRRAVAQQLGLAEGTVASRLARGRIMLAKRLAKRGVTVSAGALTAALGQNAASAFVPPSAVSATIKALTAVAAGQAVAAGIISANVAALMKGVLLGMLLNKLKVTASTVLLLVAAGFGAGGVLYATQGQDVPAKSVGGAHAQGEPAGTQPVPALPPLADTSKDKRGPDVAPPVVPIGKAGTPQLGTAPPPAGALNVPRPLTIEELKRQREEQQRRRYLQLQEELTRHLSPDQLAGRVGVLEKEVTGLQQEKARVLKEQKAAEELRKVTEMLEKIASTYADTEAGRKAQRAREAMNPAPMRTTPRVTDAPLPIDPKTERPSSKK